MTEAMNEQNEFRKALDLFNKLNKSVERLENNENVALKANMLCDFFGSVIRESLEFMAANHEAVRDGVIVPEYPTQSMTDAGRLRLSGLQKASYGVQADECYITMTAAAKLSQGD